jgi:hypothetical protein
MIRTHGAQIILCYYRLWCAPPDVSSMGQQSQEGPTLWWDKLPRILYYNCVGSWKPAIVCLSSDLNLLLFKTIKL